MTINDSIKIITILKFPKNLTFIQFSSSFNFGTVDVIVIVIRFSTNFRIRQ